LLVEGGVLGALLIFSRSPWYPAHAAGVRDWGTTLLADQQLAGLIMSVPGSAIYLVAAAALFLAWMRDEEERNSSGEASARPSFGHQAPGMIHNLHAPASAASPATPIAARTSTGTGSS